MPSRSPAAAERHCRESLERSLIRRAVAARHRRWRMRGRGLLLVGAVAMSSVGGVALASSGGASTHRTAHVTTLSRGSHGRAVVILQHALGVRPTGTYDAATVRAVRSFQARHGLTVDGVAGPKTLAALGIASKLQGAGYGGNVTAELAKIARCESGGDPRAVSADGRFRGKYQFDRATWRSIGGHGDPAHAPESVQDRLAAKLLRQRGTAPWPNCA